MEIYKNSHTYSQTELFPTHLLGYIYIYIYIERERERETDRQTDRPSERE